MIDQVPKNGHIRKWGRRALLLCAGLAILVSGALVLGTFVPSTPYLGVYGSFALSWWPGWVFVAAVVGGSLAFLSARGTPRRILIAVAAGSAIGALVVTTSLVNVAIANKAEIGWGAPFGFGGLFTPTPPDKSFVYTRDLGEELKIHIWQPETPPPEGGWPVIMYVHGGGWVTGNPEDRGADMRWFADRGWLAVAIRYSLSSPKRHLWNKIHGQIGCALVWMDTNKDDLGADPRRMALFGESAGGNLVLNAASMANAGTLVSGCGGTVPRLRAVSAVYPAVDIGAVARNQNVPSGDGVRSMAMQYTGGLPETVPERYAATNSGNLLTAASPPTLLFIPENDHLVPPESQRAYAAAAQRAGVKTRVLSIPYGEHGFEITGIGNAIVRQATLQFLRENVSKSQD